MSADLTVAKTIGWRSGVRGALDVVRPHCARPPTVSTKGIVCRWKATPGKLASSALPSVSAVMPVLSETKNAVLGKVVTAERPETADPAWTMVSLPAR